MKKLSIIIPVFNKFNFTLSCINGLFKSNIANQLEIIIVDNASSDNTQKELSQIKQDNFIYIRNEENLFHSKGCNVGYQKSSGDNILFLNNDIKIKSNDWAEIILDHCNDAIVGPTMGQLDNNFNFIREANKQLEGNVYISGWCIASSRSNCNKLDIDGKGQIWNEKFPFYWNDTDLSWRARKTGLKLMVMNIPLVHFGKISSSQLNVQKLYLEGRKTFLNKWA
jgi:GT2 family glycosyltransferase